MNHPVVERVITGSHLPTILQTDATCHVSPPPPKRKHDHELATVLVLRKQRRLLRLYTTER
jgi:hypothetical protein